MKRALTPMELGFIRRDERQLSIALKETNQAREFRRIQAVLLVAEGHRVADAAHITTLSQSTIYYLLHRYLQTHVATSLRERERSGRPRIAPAITEARILRELNRSPLHLGYRTNVWTVELLANHMAELYQCDISPHTLRRRMRAMGLRCKRPRYVYSEKDPHRAQKKGLLSGN
jgi:transposase